MMNRNIINYQYSDKVFEPKYIMTKNEDDWK